MASTPVRAAFGLLVLATIAAFFVTQQLKSEFPLVIRFAAAPADISPNGDHFRDVSVVGFDLSEPAEVTFTIVDSEGKDVRTIVDDKRLAGDAHHRFRWDGRNDDGVRVPDGVYRMRVVRRKEGKIINSLKEIDVDTVPPKVRITSARPNLIAPGEPGQSPEVKIRYAGPENHSPEFRIFRTDEGKPRVVARFRGDESKSATWHGSVRGHPAAEGDYAFTVTVRDKAGNLGVAPRPIPTARTTAPGTGVSVRPISLSGPLGVVAAGSLAHFDLGPFDRSFDFALARLGDPHVVRKGGRIGGSFRVRIPRGSRTGVYVLRVKAGRRRASWPVAVAGLPQTRRASGRPRPLVVLPSLSWQGANPIDDDFDGFADTLDDPGVVKLDRPFAHGGLPRGFQSEVAPLLRFLDRAHLAYDLTTDLSLAAGDGPSLGNAPGVALAGSEHWLPVPLDDKLPQYVKDGGFVAVFGSDSLRRLARVSGDEARRSATLRTGNVLGERVKPLLRTTEAPLVVDTDSLGLFEGSDNFVGEFTAFEPSAGTPAGPDLLTAAGRDPDEPALVAYKLGKGLVVRMGTPQWAAQLSRDRLGLELPRATQRLWSLLQQARLPSSAR
jgi:hypothetical protein